MRAMSFHGPGRPLRLAELPEPEPGPDQLLIEVHTCGVCRTDLHIVDGELSAGHTPLILGHQIVGTVAGSDRRVGVPWLGWTCGACEFCLSGRENLCDLARFTGRDIDGGFAELTVADERFCFDLPAGYPDLQAAPLLCAGLIGYRALRVAGDPARLGLYGFGAAAHIVCQVAVAEGRRVFAFTRPDDNAAQALARELGAEWTGDSMAPGPEPLDAAIIFAPAGQLIPAALRSTAKGGVVVCAGIHMSDIPSFAYADLWGERSVRSVANLTRADGDALLALAPSVPVQTHVRPYALEELPQALDDLRAGRLQGAAAIDVRGSLPSPLSPRRVSAR
jgi:propanol-preferring alcohol dehydrogenase